MKFTTIIGNTVHIRPSAVVSVEKDRDHVIIWLTTGKFHRIWGTVDDIARLLIGPELPANERTAELPPDHTGIKFSGSKDGCI